MPNLQATPLILAILLAFPAVAVKADEVDTLRAENAQLKAQVAQLQQQVQALQQAVNQLQQLKQTQSDELSALRKKQVASEQEKVNLQAKLTAAEANGDELVARRVKLFTKFDGDANRTTVSTDYYLFDLGGPLRSKQAFRLTYDFAGKQPPAKPNDAAMHITAQHTGGLYAHVKTGVFYVDGKTYACVKSSYDSKRKRGVGKRSKVSYDEKLTLAVPPSVLAAIAKGQSVRLTLGRTDIKLQGDALAAFTAIHRRARQ